jgi:hypothetical protein
LFFVVDHVDLVGDVPQVEFPETRLHPHRIFESRESRAVMALNSLTDEACRMNHEKGRHSFVGKVILKSLET